MTLTLPRTRTDATNVVASVERPDDFDVVGSEHTLGFNRPQRMGRRLWLPMFLMALMGWSVGIVLAVVEAGTDRAEADTLQTLSHLVPAFMFIGFLGVFSAITFAIARILGEFRNGGGMVQETAGALVQTLKMPATARAMIAFMMMGVMVMAAGIVTNVVAAVAYDGTSAADLVDSALAAAAGSGLRRLGVASFLTGITFGLGSIIHVLHFQASRIREVAVAHGHLH